ncbi:MAG: tripartite tricarboxylate transporter TctB family protein [Deltaproteobacteria bacterium]|nr:tripartite tricarboxylate transporter TctB family protein [Deltaproteobacteria bacterium]
MKLADIISGIIGILIGVYVWIKCQSYPEDFVMKIGPGFFPEFLAGGLILFSAFLIIQALLGKSIGTVEKISIRQKGIQRVLLALAGMIVYCAVLKPVGFIIATIPWIMFYMYLLGNRKKLQYLWVPAAITLAVYLVFEKVLVLSLPAGLLRSIL